MICLGIETSCDDTSLALVEDGQLLGQVISSQESLHALFGGVVPELASREHARLIGPLCDHLFELAGKSIDDISLISVSRGPGLLGSLLVGVSFAKSLALSANIDFIGVNHLHAHLLVAGLEQRVTYPALGLLVSGGHTHLYKINSSTSFCLLGKSLDDAAGEAFDKAGKMMGLPYPAGKYIDNLASRGEVNKKLFPKPYLNNDTLDFSFSGLKTAMSSYLRSNSFGQAHWDVENKKIKFSDKQSEKDLSNTCASYSYAVVETLCTKVKRAIKQESGIRSLILAGGVASNSMLRKCMQEISEKNFLEFIVPSYNLCTDNAAMVAYLGYLLNKEGYSHNLSMMAIPRGKIIPEDMIIKKNNKNF